MYSGFQGRTIIFCETKKEAQELSQDTSIKQVGPSSPFPLGKKHLLINSQSTHVRAHLICQSPLKDKEKVAQTQGYTSRVDLITLIWRFYLVSIVGYNDLMTKEWK